MMLNIFNKAGLHKVETAENGYQAFEMVQNKHYDLIVLDLNMPIMNGY